MNLLPRTLMILFSGVNDEFRMEMLEDEKQKQLVENINQYNHLLGNFMNKLDTKSDISENRENKGMENSTNHQQMLSLKVSLVQFCFEVM